MYVTEILYRQTQEKRKAQQQKEPEKQFRKCAYPSCQEKASWDSFCWEHYQEERYTSR